MEIMVLNAVWFRCRRLLAADVKLAYRGASQTASFEPPGQSTTHRAPTLHSSLVEFLPHDDIPCEIHPTKGGLVVTPYFTYDSYVRALSTFLCRRKDLGSRLGASGGSGGAQDIYLLLVLLPLESYLMG